MTGELTIDFEIGDIVETFFRASNGREDILYHQLILSEKSLEKVPPGLRDNTADYEVLYLKDFTGQIGSFRGAPKSRMWARFILREDFGFPASRILYKINP